MVNNGQPLSGFQSTAFTSQTMVEDKEKDEEKTVDTLRKRELGVGHTNPLLLDLLLLLDGQPPSYVVSVS